MVGFKENMDNHKKRYFELVGVFLKDIERYSIFLTRNMQDAKDLVSESILKGYDSYIHLKKEKAFIYF